LREGHFVPQTIKRKVPRKCGDWAEYDPWWLKTLRVDVAQVGSLVCHVVEQKVLVSQGTSQMCVLSRTAKYHTGLRAIDAHCFYREVIYAQTKDAQRLLVALVWIGSRRATLHQDGASLGDQWCGVVADSVGDESARLPIFYSE
jgi:hypothetical protein